MNKRFFSMAFVATLVVFMPSCNDDSTKDITDLSEEDVIVVSSSDEVDSHLLTILPERSNKSAKNFTVVKNAGNVDIDGQTYGTVIVGNQRWITKDYGQPIDYPDDFELWTARQEFRSYEGKPGDLQEHFRADLNNQRTHFFCL